MYCKTGLYTIYSTFFSFFLKKIKLLHTDTFWQDLNLTVKPSKSRKSWHKTLFPFWNIAPVLSKCSHCSGIPVAIFFSAFLILKLPFSWKKNISEIKHSDLAYAHFWWTVCIGLGNQMYIFAKKIIPKKHIFDLFFV